MFKTRAICFLDTPCLCNFNNCFIELILVVIPAIFRSFFLAKQQIPKIKGGVSMLRNRIGAAKTNSENLSGNNLPMGVSMLRNSPAAAKTGGQYSPK
jgi:hypothetical protein